jgi:hypothetical protein
MINNNLLKPLSLKETNLLINKAEWKYKEARVKGRFVDDILPPTLWEYAEHWVGYKFLSNIQKDAAYYAVGDSSEELHSGLTPVKNRFNFWLWGQGSGKSTLLSFLVSYFIFWNEHLTDFRQYYNKSGISTLDYLLVSCDKDNAADILLKNLKGFIQNTKIPGTDTKWWEHIAKMDMREGMEKGKNVSKNRIITPKGQRIIQRSTSKNAVEGLECFLGAVDEVSHTFGRHDVMKTMIDTIRGNIFGSRYPNHGKLFLVSYPNDQFDPQMDYMRANAHIFKERSERSLEKRDTFYSIAKSWEVNPDMEHNEGMLSAYEFDETAAKLRYECISPQGKYPIFKITDINKMVDKEISPVISYRIEEIRDTNSGKDEGKIYAELVDPLHVDKHPRVIAIDSGKNNFSIMMARTIAIDRDQASEFSRLKKNNPELEDIIISGIPVIDAIIKLEARDDNKKKTGYTVKYECIVEILAELCEAFNIWAVYADSYQIETFSDKIKKMYIPVEEIKYNNRKELRKMVQTTHVLISNNWIKICGTSDSCGNNHSSNLIEAIKSANWKGNTDFVSTDPHLLDTFVVISSKASTELLDRAGGSFFHFKR